MQSNERTDMGKRQDSGVDLERGHTLAALTTEIVSAFVSNNSIPASEIPALIADIHLALTRVCAGHNHLEVEGGKPKLSWKKTVTADYIVCLEDNKKFKSLKRHLKTHHNMTPEQYRAKHGLPADYPMVAPNYALARSDLAKRMGLGTRREK